MQVTEGSSDPLKILTRFSAASQKAAVSTPASVMGTSSKDWDELWDWVWVVQPHQSNSLEELLFLCHVCTILLFALLYKVWTVKGVIPLVVTRRWDNQG